MDAPTTTSADNGTSGESGGGWFAPRRQPTAGTPRPAPDPDPGDHRDGEQSAREQNQDRIPGPSRPVTPIRPVGSGASRARPASVTTPAPTEMARTRQASGADTEAPAAHPRESYPAPAASESAGVPLPAAVPAQAAARAPEPAQEHPGPVPPPEPAQEQPVPNPPTGPTAAATSPDSTPADSTPAAATSPAPTPAAPTTPVSPDAARIRRTMAEIGPVADKVTSYFYALLFVRHPDLRELFPAAMDTQRDRLLKALLTAAEHIDNSAVLTEYLRNLGRGHRKYGTQSAHYPAVGEALLGALSRYATTTWDSETEAAWIRTYTAISQIMIDAAAENELKAPPWWQAEVISHDLRTPDIAVITLRPDQPYPFLAGQYTSLETPWWPRIWRHYSFAAAPRSDGLLSFHVKAVPAGWVSNALVQHARPGDVLRLGAPAGSMVVDHSTDNGMLCLGGGTGIAPIKALVEDVAEHGERRPVEVFYGARTGHDLYDIDTMLRLQQSHSWLSVRPVVDDRAQFPDAVREFGPWTSYDAYLSGPPGMIRSGVDALRGLGIPFDRIRHDSVEELVAAGD
ncbi:globin domain-containing protein [Streptomyces sp. H27-C3]|uniref:globin domain-containing protein n=1 Tax=Streptomyces sp. H27-C3 TaxID=3046305 RepID=UPI0024B9B7D2|nr:globin domain-containing protein [Streptomyces sp. H27-C3]MDJ0466174.1 FAD-binding oxidoreductase [Streptomyces sp. H27-C3]